MLRIIIQNRRSFKTSAHSIYDEQPFKKYLAKGYAYNSTGLSFLRPNILDQYYGAGNLYMTPTDMGKLITQIQQYKLFSPKITNPLLHEFGTKSIQMNIDMVSMLSQH
ncbi:FmtA protein involved in methicillin resistance; affects cell wall cross-linking and amidation [Staphylococcus aureus]|uniref:FmtA protein involved in methicillin resistance affects cell wall cross-linking and amidation n=1 Tax=Staphylococcus aureus TaxID=1280 RepID=A0A380EFW4_STAAU|nr:FmtA protein involved in methicillin resistance; affects cell wall cross-linking and amidation [Staphylococcus aureus]